MRAAARTVKAYTPSGRRQNPQPSPSTIVAEVSPDLGTPVASSERIRERAYQIFQERIRRSTPGDPLSDWLQAERDCACQEIESKAGALRAHLRGETLLKDPG